MAKPEQENLFLRVERLSFSKSQEEFHACASKETSSVFFYILVLCFTCCLLHLTTQNEKYFLVVGNKNS